MALRHIGAATAEVHRTLRVLLSAHAADWRDLTEQMWPRVTCGGAHDRNRSE